MTLPLEGTRIVDLTQFVAGPMATMILADQGADVIKVEPPDGGDLTRRLGAGPVPGMSPTFVTTNRNKRSVAVDLRRPEGLGVVRRLVAAADLFVENFRPGVVERLGLDEPSLRAVRSDLVYVSIRGFGESGPYAHKRAYDPVIQATSGLADIQSDPETNRPRMMRLIVPDKVTALTAAQAMTAALLARSRTGEGQRVRLSMLDAVIAFLWPEGMAGHTYERPDPRPARWLSKRDLIFETTDGFLTVGAVSDAEWRGLAEAVGHPEWIDDPRFRTPVDRLRNVDARLDLTAEAIRSRSTSEWLATLERAGVPCARVNRREDLFRDPQVAANGLIVEREHPHAGRMREPRPPVRFGEQESPLRHPAPLLGEHTDEVLTEAGLGDEIDRLRGAGVVR
ncbi:MAG: CaiB/BaiF CoA transferase family protein [Candidatus Binatia bacterium]